MLVRVAVVCACVLGVTSAFAEELAPEQARAFVVGKLFAYNCFDGTAGVGRIFADGSVVGTVRPPGSTEVRFADLAARHHQGDRQLGVRALARLADRAVLSRCRRSTTAASAARSLAWALPIATSISAIRAPQLTSRPAGLPPPATRSRDAAVREHAADSR